ncbi:ATPase V [Enterococcus sp. 669A]|uniref:ATPase V n=1 Tax=Candidatus Enterococcus moelleringii TaxID=2815325 RepID=A0ABS3LBU7_9ENTE|nr:ATPase V [Enterococcus sp. 669A]MBO1307106.1 ATPase V [Enterococcus sp. 669A]
MSAIEKITEQMKSQANQELALLEKTEKERVDADFQKNQAIIQENFEKQRSKQIDMIQSKYRQLSNRQQIEHRQQTLNLKQQRLNQLFEEAKEEMEAWTPAEMQEFARAVLPVIPFKGQVTFVPGEKSCEVYTEEFLQQVEVPYQLVYSDQPLAKQAGFVVDSQGVQYNFIFSSLVVDVQGELSYELAQEIFG